MKLYLYIDGVIMPCAPRSASIGIAGGGEYILLHGGEHHVIPSASKPEALAIDFSIPDDEKDYENRDCPLSYRELYDFITARASAPFELVLIGVNENGGVLCDINMTVLADSIGVTLNDDGYSVTLKAKRFVRSEVA